jgi:TM2 domain-containing membrane protein YozV
MKSKVAAGVLGIVLGGFGVHRFYLGQVGLGILYLLFFWTGIPWLIGWVDGIIMLTSDDEAFNFKYNKEYYYSKQNQGPQSNQNTRRNSRPESRASYNKYQDREEERQRQRERQQRPKHQPVKNNPYKDEGTKLYRDYDFRGAIKSYQMALKVNSNDSIVHFNLACLYSLEEDKEHSYLHLSKAVQNGFAMYDKIREHDHLAFLRTDPSFETFVANGYKTHAAYDRPAMQALPPKQVDEINLMSDEVMRKLEQIGKLKELGLLTDAEFNAQKAILLKTK